MKKYIILFAAVSSFAFLNTAIAQETTKATVSPKLTTSATPTKVSLKDQIEQVEKKLEIIQANPSKYTAEKLASVERRLNELNILHSEKQVDGMYPEPQPETPWKEITKEEVTKLPEGTQKRVKVLFNKETGKRTQHFYIRSEQ